MHLSLVIPAYNEADRIGATLAAVLAYFGRQDYRSEIIVVDDGSTDDTAGVVGRYCEENPERVRLASLPGNRGKGYAVRTGMLNLAAGDYRFYYDADGSTPIEELDRCPALFDGARILSSGPGPARVHHPAAAGLVPGADGQVL